MPDTFDVIIIGGGVVGCMTARALSRYRLSVLLIEKEADIGMGASSANSAIIHAGYDPVPGTLKAKMNVAGNALWDSLAGELNFHFDRRGDFVVAVGPEEIPTLDKLYRQGKKNGVPGMRLISGEEMRRREPAINPAVSGALWAYTGGVIDPFAATIASAENALHNGVEIALQTAFAGFVLDGKRIVGVRTDRGDYACRWVVNSAGLFADDVMHKAGVRPEFRINPRRGEYFVLDRSEITVNNVLFPVPTEKGKGILVTGTTHGNPIVGPTSMSMQDKEDRSSTPEGQEELWQGARKLVPSLKISYVISSFVGLRATGNAYREDIQGESAVDFVIEIPAQVSGLVNLGGIESPGLTSAPAIALRVVELLKDAGLEMVEKPDWDPVRLPRPRFCEMTREEQALLVSQDSRYGRVICRCEMVTEGEIAAEIHAPIPATTYDAIKRRTWLGTGRCLGSFDTPRVVSILADEMGLSPLQISKKGPGSEFLMRETKTWEV